MMYEHAEPLHSSHQKVKVEDTSKFELQYQTDMSILLQHI